VPQCTFKVNYAFAVYSGVASRGSGGSMNRGPRVPGAPGPQENTWPPAPTSEKRTKIQNTLMLLLCDFFTFAVKVCAEHENDG
jgi:hypothetical protein